MVYKWYILPIGDLYITYHLLREPGNSIDMTFEDLDLLPFDANGKKYQASSPKCFFFLNGDLPLLQSQTSPKKKSKRMLTKVLGTIGFRVPLPFIIGYGGATTW